MRLLLLFVSCFLLYYSVHAQKLHPEINKILGEIKNFNTAEWRSDSSANRPLRSNTEASNFKRYTFYKKIHQKLKNINNASLSFDDQINRELLMHDVLDEISSYQYKSFLIPLLSDNGFHTSLAGRGNTTIASKKDAEDYLETLKDIPQFVDEHITLIKTGLQNGVHQPKVILPGILDPFSTLVTDTVEKFVLWKPFTKKPSSISESEWKTYQQSAHILLKNNIIPSFKKLDDFFQKEYMPKARTTLGAAHFPDGKKYYEDRVRHYTTTNLSSEEVYNIGLKEVARIRGEMDAVLKQVEFKGSFKEFIVYLRTDPKFYPKTADELLKEAAYISKKVDGKLPSLFGKLPRQPYTVAPVPEHLAPAYTAG
ncbi:MAG TPA: DUF885 domain-containing protein, partial [Flavisolibacter sp.]|nr:DUF885 domain-containing protein [Flavisolibacter sp.]